jgi:hypothetical protein
LRYESDLSETAREELNGSTESLLRFERRVSGMACDNIAQNVNRLVRHPKTLTVHLSEISEAAIPGTSRSGATIFGGLAQKLNRKTAAEFSFFLAVPTMFGATAKKGYDYYNAGFELSNSQINYLIIGNIIAFIVALIAIKSFIEYLSKKGFKIFGYYRIILGVALLIIHFFIYRLTTI